VDCPSTFFVSEKNNEPDDGEHLKFGSFAISILAIFKGVHQPFVFGGWVTGFARFMSLVKKHHFKPVDAIIMLKPLLW